jgi:1-acyl-sn-glycerol-3-phosphate acyltransferase
MDWQFSTPAIVARETTARLVGPFVAWIVGGPRVAGREQLAAAEAPFFFCPNHSSHFDVSTLRLALGPRYRRRLAAAAAQDYFFESPGPRRFLAEWLGAFAFRRRGPSADSIAQVERMLSRGWSVIVFPEGTRSRSGEVAAFKPGIGLMAVRTGRPVVPVRMIGLHDVLPPGGRLPRRRQVEVRFGQPLVAEHDEDPRVFTARLAAAVRAL